MTGIVLGHIDNYGLENLGTRLFEGQSNSSWNHRPLA